MTSLLGGLAAEELIFKKTYDNLKNSLDAVDDIVFKMAACGMLGLKLHHNEYREYKYSEKRREQLEEAFLMLKEECYEKAKEIVNKNEALIKKLVPILIKRKSIEKNECEALIEELGGVVTV